LAYKPVSLTALRSELSLALNRYLSACFVYDSKRERAMTRNFRILGLTVSTLLLPVVAIAQAPPESNPPIPSKSEQLDPNACSHGATVGQGGLDTRKTDGRNLSDQLAQSGGVICPPSQADPAIEAPTPPGGDMRVIPPPGSPGGDQSVQPK
jgi:hypothetical protein